MARNNPEWPRGKEDGAGRNSPVARYQVPDGFLNSELSLAGPLRTGTSPDVGPRARGASAVGVSRESDFGMDRVGNRRFDPIGTPLDRMSNKGMPASLITKQINR